MSAPEQGGLSEVERAAIRTAMRGYAFGPMYDAIERILAARLATVPAADAELRAAVEGLADLSAAATPGPWEVWDNTHGDPHIVEHGRGPLTGGIALANTRDDYGRSNATFIVAAVNLVRSLLAGRGDV